MSYHENLTNKQFDYLTAVKYVGHDARYNAVWECLCKCGNIKLVRAKNLKNRSTKSCGCKKSEILSRLKTKHNLSRSRIYKCYYAMINRCYSPKNKRYDDYGGRGIKVCDEWLNKIDGRDNFIKWAFKNGYTDQLTIDRINVNGNYEPSNCKWSTQKEQANNRRNNKKVVKYGTNL